jgi:hypothetical protein
MRIAAIVAILVASTVLLSGCAKKAAEDDHSYVCKNATSTVTIDLEKYPEHHNATFNPASKCPGVKSSASNTTSLAPNKLPILKMKITDGTNVTNVTMLNGNLTFDATGSTDPDGTVTGIAVTVKDSNQTRTAALFDPVKKTFKPAHFKFDRPGVVNVTVAMVDDRAGFTINQTHVYVDQTTVLDPKTVNGFEPGGDSTTCSGPFNALVDTNFANEYDFTLVAGATFVEATATNGKITICAPGPGPSSAPGTPRSPEGSPSTTTDKGADLTPAKGVLSYFVEAYSTSPNQSIGVTVTVHYEPDTRS